VEREGTDDMTLTYCNIACGQVVAMFKLQKCHRCASGDDIINDKLLTCCKYWRLFK